MHIPCTVSNVLRVILIKMARAFAEGVIISIIGLERCIWKTKVEIRIQKKTRNKH